MDIKGKLTLIGVLPLMMTLTFGLSVYLGQSEMYALREATQMADAMESQLDLLKSTAFEYFDDRGARPREQSYAAFDRAAAVLARGPGLFSGRSDRDLLEDISARLSEARWTFGEFDTLARKDLNAIQEAYARDVAQRLNMELRSIEPLLRALHHNAHRQVQGFSEKLWLMEMGMLVLTALLTVLLMVPVLYRIRTGLSALSAATQTLGEGGLGVQLALPGHDEFSALARDFNTMAQRLTLAESARAKRTEELEIANQDLESFSYSVSHDLRAPLRAIDGFISILLEEYGERLDAEGTRLFGVVQDNAVRMGQLIDDILALSRAGRLELEPLDVDMQRLVEEVWEGLAEQREGRRVEFRLQVLPPVRCDPRAMRQIWQNLLENALKFTRQRDPAIIEVSGEIDPQRVCYRVADNGVGFDPRYGGKLFSLFQRLHGMDEFEGTGVGLSIVQRLLRKHGGQIEGRSERDAGARFEFTLPRPDGPDR